MKIIIDSREGKRIESAKEYFEKNVNEVTVEELVGDYLFNDEVVFEYKRIDDFFSSLNDNRLMNQAINQYENYDKHFVIIEKNKNILNKMKKRWNKNDTIKNSNRYDGIVSELNQFTTVIEKEKPRNNVSKQC